MKAQQSLTNEESRHARFRNRLVSFELTIFRRVNRVTEIFRVTTECFVAPHVCFLIYLLYENESVKKDVSVCKKKIYEHASLNIEN